MPKYRDRDWLFNIYIVENKTLHEIAEILGCDYTTIGKWLIKFNIKKDLSAITKKQQEKFKKTILEKHKNDLYADREWLYNQYVVLNKSEEEIEKEFGFKHILYDWLKRFNIKKPKEKIFSKIKNTWENKTKEQIDAHTEKTKKSKLEKYGEEFYSNSEKAKETKHIKYGDENYNNSEKTKETNIKRYGVSCIFHTQQNKEKVQSESSKNKFRISMKKSWANKTIQEKKEIVKKIKDTCAKKFGCPNILLLKENREKAFSKESFLKSYESKKRNNSFNISRQEKEILEFLRQYYPNIKHQYKSERYPFNCDYYIPELDLYVEFNGTWTHGKEPFDNNNLEHIDKLNMWKSKNTKFYNTAIYVWTQLDPKKRLIAKQNNIKLIEIWFNDYLKGLEYIYSIIKNK